MVHQNGTEILDQTKKKASEVTHSGTLLTNEESSFLKSGADKMFLESLVLFVFPSNNL